jgi:tRNA(Ile2) C34 agmatinyltransferase TiaS
VTIKPAYWDDRKGYSRNLLNLKNIPSRKSASENVNAKVSKYCERCRKWVNWVSEGALYKCRECGKILR